MTTPTSVQLAARIYAIAKQLRGEADRHPAPIRDELMTRAQRLTYAWPAAYSEDPEDRAEVARMLEAAIDCLVDVVMHRTERELAKGVTP